MRKLPVFVLAAAAFLTVAGTPVTAHAATIQVSGRNNLTTNCRLQNGSLNKNDILSQLGVKDQSIDFGSCNQQNDCKNDSSCSKGSAFAGRDCSIDLGNSKNCGQKSCSKSGNCVQGMDLAGLLGR